MTADRAFGAWLRQLRLDHDLTQEGLAELAGCAAETLRSFENGRRRPSRAIAERLALVLGLTSEERERFVGLARQDIAAATAPQQQHAAPEPPAAQPFIRGLPLATDALIGRRRELQRLQQLLQEEQRRLVTALGPGGVGKTRLALQSATELQPGFPDGAVFVSLAPFAEAPQALSAIADALGCVPAPDEPIADALLAALAGRRLLLVLDNLEHLLGPTQADLLLDLVLRLLREAPTVQLLVTSRERLHLQAEQVLELGGLDLPADEAPSAIAGSDAVLLFVERAARTAPSFALTAANRTAVSNICRRLEGMPLAIELAAAQVSFLPPTLLLQRLAQALTVLESDARELPKRQRTMRATIDWSYTLLEADERTLFQRLAVFAGGFTLEAAEAVGGAAPLTVEQCLRLLGRLVNRSLVLRGEAPDGTVRYRLLEPVRQYALERLREDGAEAEAAQRRHAAHFVALARTAAPLLRTMAQVREVERLEREYADLSAAMAWLLAHSEAARAASFGRDLWLFLWMRGHFRDGQRWMGEALDQLPAAPSQGRADALLALCVLAYGQADYERATALAEQALAEYEAIGDPVGTAESLSMVGMGAAGLKQFERAEPFLERAVPAQLAAGNPWAAAMTLTFWAPIALNQGALRRAAALAEQARTLARELGERIVEYSAAYNLALVAQAEGDSATAAGLFASALTLAVELDDRGNIVACLKGLGGVAVTQGRFERAARLWGAAEALSTAGEAAQYSYSLDRALYAQLLEQVQAGLDPGAWEAVWAAGRALSLADAVAEALAAPVERRLAVHEAAPDASVPPASPVSTVSTIPGVIRRTRLLERLQQRAARFTLVVAPPGFGKSVLLAQWHSNVERKTQNVEQPGSTDPALRFAWLALDEQHNDPSRFLADLVALVAKASPALGEQIALLLNAPPPPRYTHDAEPTNGLHASTGSLILVLDDYHVLASAAPHELLVTLVERAPAALRVVVASRSDPPLPLARWRASGLLRELRAADLRFDAAEVAVFLDESLGLPLSEEQLATLAERTEGWPVGLRLAGLALQGHPDPADFIAAFNGSHRYVLDYLVDEVLSTLPAHLRRFLLQTAVLRRLSAPLCDALLGLEAERAGEAGYSSLLLAELERRNLFLVPLDDRGVWYRYHQLFADVLLAQLTAGASAAEVAALHQKAARWYAAAGEHDEALHHARLVQAPPLAVSPARNELLEPLTERELEVLRLLSAGRSNQAIADELTLAIGTVKRHLNNIFGKLGVASRGEAIVRAHALGLFAAT
jgi:ATP/maltotriose-dependent transcriptional regulator MalT/predicted ATPase/DNA-binding XRE family transcriptional regulator